jgi:hypothetical protein
MANVIVFIELVSGTDYGHLNLYCNPVLHLKMAAHSVGTANTEAVPDASQQRQKV